MIFETRFVNKRDSAVRVFEYGRELIRLQPGEARHVESRSPKTSWARWSVVKFSGDDKVSFDENKDWQWPWPGQLKLEFVNLDGTATEGLLVAGQIYHSEKNIPRLIPISPRDTSWCFIQKIERRLVEHRVREGDFIIKKKILEDVKTPRSRKECRAIEKQLEDAAVEKARQEIQRQFPKPVETEANTDT
jgi:hypothetical protein